MSRTELKVGDVVFYEGNRGVVRHIFNDGKENYYKIELTITSSRFLYADELDFSLDQPTLNESQMVVLEWLKKEYFDSYVKSVLSNLYFYVNLTAVGDLENEEIKSMVDAYEKLEDKEFAQVLQAFASWVSEQEEE